MLNNLTVFFGIFLVSMLFIPSSMPPTEAQDTPYFGAIVELDKVVYSWTGYMWITVVAPDFNSDSDKIEYIGDKPDNRITITSTNGKKLDFYKLVETDVDTGVFVGAVLLTGFSYDTDGDGIDDPIMVKLHTEGHATSDTHQDVNENLTGASFGKGPWDGRIKAEPGNTFTVRFSETYSGTTNNHDATMEVNWWLAELDLQPSATLYSKPASVIKVNEPVTVTVVDVDMNLGEYNRDSFYVTVYSDSDASGFQLLLTETEMLDEVGNTFLLQYSGIFEGEIIFTDCSPIEQQNNICTANPSAKVLAKPGDTITVEYNDYTLPFPNFLVGEHLTLSTTAKMSGIKTPTPTPTPAPTPAPAVTPDELSATPTSFKKYVDRKERFSIEYPGNWLKGADGLGHIDSVIAFSDKANWNVMTQVFFYDGDTPDDRTDSQILKQLEYNDSEVCEDYTFALDDRICYDYESIDSYTMEAFNGNKMYFVKSSYTLEFDDPSFPGEYPMISAFGLVYGKDGSWEINTESDDFAFVKNSDEIMLMTKSLSVEPNAQQQAQSTAKSVTAIPDWIKNNAGWWASGQIPDSAFLQGIEFLINEGIMIIPPTETSGSSDSQGVPAWVKNNAEWWAGGQIDDNSFVLGIQYLVKVGIIQVG